MNIPRGQEIVQAALHEQNAETAMMLAKLEYAPDFIGRVFCRPLSFGLVPAFERALVESGIILIRYLFEVSQEEQTRRFQGRINDGRKIWKLSPMDLESHRRC